MEAKKWWKEAVVYQIYPRSFCDSNGDGIGDINGIRSKLDYVKRLGITCIWLSPIFQSPQDDNGYDISDYRAIAPEFGTMADFEHLLREAHERDIRILMDLVVNHTSDEHPWFQESRKSKENPYRDYYIWRDGKTDGKPPSDWGSHFSGSAWEYDAQTDQYYLHLFSKKQPDLNWENPRVRQEVRDIIHFWSKKGVDGYRIDTVCMYSKNMDFPDTGEEHRLAVEHFNDGPKMHDYLQELHDHGFEPYDAMTVGEANNIPIERALRYVGEDRKELSMLFHFEHVNLGGKYDTWTPEAITPQRIKTIFSRWQTAMHEEKGWNTLYWSNHDQPRVVSRFGDDTTYWKESAKMLATILHLQKGTPFIYQGEEIGMTNVPFQRDEYRDIEAIRFLNDYEQKHGSVSTILEAAAATNRDNARTPMQWNARKNAGFTTGMPWIKIAPNFQSINVQAEEADPDSILHYYQALVQLRKDHPVIIYGKYQDVDLDHPQVYAFLRIDQDETLLVIANMTKEHVTYALPKELEGKKGEILLKNGTAVALAPEMNLPPYACMVYRLLG